MRLAIVASLALVIAGPAGAALDHDQFKCQNTVAKQGRVFFKKTFKALAKCRDAINKGKLPTGTDCTLESKTADKLSKAETKFREKVQDKCSDALVTSLDFGGSCFGVTTEAELEDCLVEEHSQAASDLIGVVYDDASVRHCDGGDNDGNVCTDTVDCPNGKGCVLDKEQWKCAKILGKVLVKQANKRQAILQKCKKKISLGKITADIDCTDEQKLDDLMAKSVDKIRQFCPQAVVDSLAFGGSCDGASATDAVAACSLCSDDQQVDDLISVQYGSSPKGATALVKQITDTADCVGGPMSRCRANDYLLANDRIRVVVQDIQRNLFGIGQFGGQIIDGDLALSNPERKAGPDRDSFEEWSTAINIEGTAHYTSLSIVNDGSNGGPAILRATGVDDLLDFLNPSAVVASFGFLLPSAVDDKPLPVDVMTDYILEPGADYVRVETTLQNTSASTLHTFFGEFINGSGQIELFQSGYGFGEPLVTTACPTSPYDYCNYVAYSGEDAADGVSYGYVETTPGSSTFSTSGVTVPQLGVQVVLALIGAQTANFAIQPMGDPGDSLTFTRYFVVGNGTVSSITDARNEIQCLPTGRLKGTVTAGGSPAARADVAVFGDPLDGPSILGGNYLQRNVITHTRTDDSGGYSLTLPVGDYTVVANLDGWPYEGGTSTPTEHPVTIAAFDTVSQDIALPATGGLQVTIEDEGNQPIAGKVSVVGFDPSSDPLNAQSILGLINNSTGVFGDRSKDGLPFGIADAIFVGPSGDSGVQPLEPGDYQVVVSHGAEYSVSKTNVTVAAAPAPPEAVAAQVDRVIDSTGFVSADFHVHSINSPDSEVSKTERVVSMLAEGMDFFTPTDHDFLTDYQPTIDDLGASDLISVATGEEITTFDYGHFNAWPLTIDPNQVNGGGVDHGGAAPAGQDFPMFGNYSETPADIIALARTMPQPGATTVQINHIHSHFGLDAGSGLAIDTGVAPPQSNVPAAAHRLDPSVTNFFTDTFDALEIWIGDNRQQIYDNFLGEVSTGNGGNIGDWFNMLNQGIIRTGVADSDTHKRIISQSGVPHNMVASLENDPGLLGPLAPTLSSTVNAGRTIGTNGPMVRVTAFASSTSESGGLDLGRCTGVVDCTDVSDCPPCTDSAECGIGESCTALPTTIATTDGNVDIAVDIQSPEWAEFDTVEFYVNPTTTRRTLTMRETGAGKIDVNRYEITPDYVKTAPADFTITTVPVNGANRLEAHATLSLNVTEDAWVVVMVRGTDGVSKPLFPVIPNDLKQNTNMTLANLTDGNLNDDGITALAFTNPIFIDYGDDGWTAPGLKVAP